MMMIDNSLINECFHKNIPYSPLAEAGVNKQQPCVNKKQCMYDPGCLVDKKASFMDVNIESVGLPIFCKSFVDIYVQQ